MTEISHDNSYKKISLEGLWHNNPGLVQLLGLCPLLAVSNTTVNALGLGIATTLVLIGSNVTVSAIRHIVRPELRIPVFVMVIACFVTIVEYLTKAFFYDLFLILGIFLPLITTNCAIIARAEAFASKNPISHALVDGLMMGLGFAAVLVVLGGLRELIGKGTIFADAHLMFGESARWMTITIIKDYDGFLLAILPPGAFIGLGLIIACKNYIDRSVKQRAVLAKQHSVAESEQTQPAT
ncbi:electron transport complex subunit E [Kaarinaea lacus]